MEVKEKDIVASMELFLSDLHVHYHNLRNFHWTVTGPQFYELHQKFEDLYRSINDLIDDVAERLLALNYSPVVSTAEIINRANIEEQNIRLPSAEMVKIVIDQQLVLIDDVKQILKLAEANEDKGTDDLLSPLIKDLEKENWMLKSYLS